MLDNGYINWLNEQILRIAHDNGMEGYTFHVFNEQDFIKPKQINKNDIFVIVKTLSAEIMLNAKVQPLQIMVMSEQNSLQVANFIFKEFASKNNWLVTIDNGTYIKHQYTEPVVLNNFEPVGTGYRSILYLSGTLYIMENVLDVDKITINNEEIEFIDFSIAYTLATDTQPMQNDYFVQSVRQTQTIAFAMTLPSKINNFTKNCFKIVGNKISGDEVFNLSFKVKGIDDTFTYSTKLSGITFATAKNNIPTMKVGLIK